MPRQHTPWQLVQYVRSGPPAKEGAPHPNEIIRLSEEHPEIYDKAIKGLYYKMADAFYKKPHSGLLDKYREFIGPWCENVDRETSQYMLASIEAYALASSAGMRDLSVDAAPETAQAVALKLANADLEPGSIMEMLVLILKGQAESLFSRTAAGQTFDAVRNSPHSGLMQYFYWDAGVLSYFNDDQIAGIPIDDGDLTLEYTWSREASSPADSTFLISVDASFFRIYGPMILFNAQQVPDIDVVVLICGERQEVNELVGAARRYMTRLSEFNAQPFPENVTFRAVRVPKWVNDVKTFYACARFLALPDVLRHYNRVYAIDADLLMRSDPAAFFKATAQLVLSVPKNTGTISAVPWRRYMAGNFVANRNLLKSPALNQLLHYIGAGLRQKYVWTLDQNALAYAIESSRPGEFKALDSYSRPLMVSNYMARWERNYRTHNPS